MKLGQATIKDIAKELNVSLSTVSRALKDYPGISNETKRKVKELAEKLNYRPNAIALSLRKSKSFTIGVIIPEVVHFFFSTVISGIEEVAFANGYNVILCQTNEKLQRELSSIEAMLDNQVDGLLVSYSKETEDFNHFTKLLKQNFPIVFFDRVPEIENTVNVTVNDFKGAYDATSHLINQGYKNIAHLAGPKNLTISRKRLDGYLAALQDHSIKHNPDWIIPCPIGTQEESFEFTKRLFENEKAKPDGIFASNDIAAAGAMMAVKSLGLKVPSDVGVVGFSDWQFSSMIDPPLSTVSQPGFQMGEKAISLLLEMINKKKDETWTPKTVVLETELIIRKSSEKIITE
ncbi:LacI family transcriptional regulator [Belliella sp. R4-6]|uniref:LacI family transcriptional regulator n=1 Tax=Belliella alkalica TaxID=1730871 RepID=A0ABS9VCX7_9BACT|nr:LacI family DNA-binding transcriptional regulator [Belliella alkalica]MCH7414284.1 LacI family transcriptional regulator [Belliella alkalica]